LLSKSFLLLPFEQKNLSRPKKAGKHCKVARNSFRSKEGFSDQVSCEVSSLALLPLHTTLQSQAGYLCLPLGHFSRAFFPSFQGWTFFCPLSDEILPFRKGGGSP
jgi:hypothetical protein